MMGSKKIGMRIPLSTDWHRFFFPLLPPVFALNTAYRRLVASTATTDKLSMENPQ
jgi:hypothetical protein